MITLLPFSLVFLSWQAQQETPSAVPDLLSRIQSKVAENLGRLPNYTCLQTIERSRRRPASHKFDPLDRIRLEVALVEGKEMFGWPGGATIAESEITNLVNGTIGNGDFALFLKSIFLGPGQTFRYAGEGALQGRRTLRFNYIVPLAASGYHLRIPPREALVPYHGSFWVDADTLDLIPLELTVDAIPPYLGLAAASDTMDYGRVNISGTQFLLPQSSELDMTDLKGWENRNQTRFTGCRQFTGESILSFGDVAAPAIDGRTPSRNSIELPGEFQGDFVLETTIDSAAAAVGDTIRAKLRREIKIPRLPAIPRGALLSFRISQLERSERGYTLAIVATSIEFDGRHAELSGRENTITIQVPSRLLRPGLGSYASDGPFVMMSTPILIPTGNLQLPAGTQLSVSSRLLQSE